VYLSGLIRDPYGQKMSKTKGNSVDPLETIDEVGADALRFALVNGTAPGNDARLAPEKLVERPQLRQQALERGALRAGSQAGIEVAMSGLRRELPDKRHVDRPIAGSVTPARHGLPR